MYEKVSDQNVQLEPLFFITYFIAYFGKLDRLRAVPEFVIKGWKAYCFCPGRGGNITYLTSQPVGSCRMGSKCWWKM